MRALSLLLGFHLLVDQKADPGVQLAVSESAGKLDLRGRELDRHRAQWPGRIFSGSPNAAFSWLFLRVHVAPIWPRPGGRENVHIQVHRG